MTNLTRTILVTLFAFIIFNKCPAEPAEQKVQYVPIFRILASPEKFDGVRIGISGFVNIAPDNAAVYISSEARRFALTSYAVWINTRALSKEAMQQAHGKCCHVVGIYHYDSSAVLKGNDLGFIGKIDVETIDKVDEEYVWRRDRLVGQLGYVNGKLQMESDKLSAKEKSALEQQRKDLEELLRYISNEESQNVK